MGAGDNAKNTAEDLKGRAKEATGALTGNENLKAEGQADQDVASAKDAVSKAADKLKDGVDSVKNKITGN